MIPRQTTKIMRERLLLRFEANIERRDDGCWEWTGARSSRGYGSIRVGGQSQGAHTLSVSLYAEQPPPDSTGEWQHSCNRPWCVNPDHLSWGTHKSNMQYMIEAGRGITPFLSGDDNPNAKLTWEDIETIRLWHRMGLANQKTIAALFGVSASTIRRAVQHKTFQQQPALRGA